MLFAFDVISDLNLTRNDEFDWAGKPTSLFCIVAGNISQDMKVVVKVLTTLSACYHGVFFIDGSEESCDVEFRDDTVDDLQKICSSIRNVVYLHNNVVVVDGVALVGINGWYKNFPCNDITEEFRVKCNRYEDISYLEKTLEKLQIHNDVRRIIVISSSVPSTDLYFGEVEPDNDIAPAHVLCRDTERKVSHWVFGTYKKEVDITKDNVNYVSNGKFSKNPYYAKRIEINL